MIEVDNPLKWLLAQLPAYIPPEAHAELLQRFDAQKRRYATAVKINELERRIKTASRFERTPERDAQIARWRSKLETLKEAANA